MFAKYIFMTKRNSPTSIGTTRVVVKNSSGSVIKNQKIEMGLVYIWLKN